MAALKHTARGPGNGRRLIRGEGCLEYLASMHARTRIAVVGAGVSGLVAAHLLGDHHDVVVFEAAARPGGHACTVDVVVPEGGTIGADVGFMVFNDRNYPRFQALLAELGVGARASDMSFSVSDGKDFEFAGSGLGAAFANPRHLLNRRF